MGTTTTTTCRISALAVCAGVGVALTGATGGTFLAAMAGTAVGGAAGNFFHQMVDGVLSWFGGQKHGPTTLPANHDLDGLTASAIKLVLETARDRLSTDDPKRSVLERLAKTPVATIFQVMQAEDQRLVGDAEIVSTLGTPAGGQTTTVATPEYWQAFVVALLNRTGAAEQPSAMNTPVRDFTDVFRLATRAVKDATKQLWDKDLTALAKDVGADAAAAFAAGLLHAHVAAFANDVLRDTFGPQGRFFVAALFNILNSIAARVNTPPAGVTLTGEQGDQIKTWVKEATSWALAAGKAMPAPQTDDERAATAEVEAQAKTLGETLRQMGEDIGYIRAGMARWCDTLAPDLVLPPRVVAKAQDRFVFRSRRLAVVGRDEELKELSAWLDGPAPFGWDLWVGPAGSGKSRLALELCDRREDWDAGFFRFDGPISPNWRDWDPKADTLVIFDYVAEDAQKIGELIDIFTRRAAGHKVRGLPPGVKVRFLLLERAAVRSAEADSPEPVAPTATTPDRSQAPAAGLKLEAPWLGVLRSAAKQNGADVESVYARGDLFHPGRYLGGVSVESAMAIIRAEHESARDDSGSPLPPITPQQWKSRGLAALRIDAHLRPLFVAMTAEAVRENGGAFDALDGGTGIDGLVQHINEKEWTHARARLRETGKIPDNQHDAWAKFLCLATMCGGLVDPPDASKRQVLTEAMAMSDMLKTPNIEAYEHDIPYVCIVSGASKNDAPKLEPDLLGEAFVLWWLDRHRRQARALIDAAWTLGMSDFVRRTAENFPARAETSGLLEPVAGADPGALTAAHTALGDREYVRGDLTAHRARGMRLLTATRADDQTPMHPPRVRALGAWMWMQGTATPEELEQFSAALGRLPAAANLDAAVPEPLAKGLFNAFNDAPANSELAHALLTRLQALAEAHPQDAVVRERLASGLNNAVSHAGADHARADDLLARLRVLAETHPLDAAVRERLAMGLNNAVSHAGADQARADDLLARLQALAETHPLDAAVREQLASGLFNGVFHAGADHTRADDLLTRLRVLAETHSLDAAVRERLANGLFKAFNDAPANSALAHALLTRLQALAEAHPQDAVVRERLASGLNNAVSHAGADHARADDLLTRLQALSGDHRQDAAVRNRLASGLFNAFNNAPANCARADGLLTRLQALAETHPLDAAVREQLASGLFNGVFHAGADHTRADDLLTRLQALYGDHRQDAAVREPFANGLMNAIARAGADHARADDLLTRLQALYGDHRQDAAVREQLAKGLFTAFNNAPANSARVDDLLARLQALADAHPLDAAVGKQACKGRVAAFVKSLEPGPPQPQHLHAMAALFPRLRGDDQVRQVTRALIDMVIQMIAQAPLPEPLKSELDSAGGALRQAYQETFGTDHQ